MLWSISSPLSIYPVSLAHSQLFHIPLIISDIFTLFSGSIFFHVNFAKDNICKYFPVVYLSPTLLDFVASRSPFKQDVKSAQSPVTDDQLELIEFYLVVLLSLHFELFLKYKYNSQLVNKQSIWFNIISNVVSSYLSTVRWEEKG